MEKRRRCAFLKAGDLIRAIMLLEKGCSGSRCRHGAPTHQVHGPENGAAARGGASSAGELVHGGAEGGIEARVDIAR